MSISHLHELRQEEFKLAMAHLPFRTADREVLEIGSGTGFQLTLLKEVFKKATGIDIEESNLRGNMSDHVVIYNGREIPFTAESVDTIYSSNVLEHIPHLDSISDEFLRVLNRDGYMIHILPSHIWRFWSVVAFYAKIPQRIWNIFKRTVLRIKPEPVAMDNSDQIHHVNTQPKGVKEKIFGMLFPERHGERGNRFTEIFYFHPNWWKRFFKRHSWEVVACKPIGLFYTGESFFGNKLSVRKRKSMARTFGSACYIFILKKENVSA